MSEDFDAHTEDVPAAQFSPCDRPQVGYCVLCGVPGYGYKSHDPDITSAEEAWRCPGCFSLNSSGARYCNCCGKGTATGRAQLSLIQSRDQVCTRAFEIERTDASGLAHVKHVGYFYGTLLSICLVSLGVNLHTDVDDAMQDMASSALMYLVIFGYVISEWSRLLPLFRLPKRWILWLFAALMAAPVTVGLAWGQKIIFPFLSKWWQNYSDVYLAAGFGWETIYLNIAVAPAFFEEIAFRGIILHRLLLVMTVRQAVWVGAMFFAILHINAFGMLVYLLPLGLIAGWFTIRAKSLWPAILLHFCHNGAVVASEWMSKHFE